MRYTLGVAGSVFLLVVTGCNVVNSDSGTTKTVEQEIDVGKAETVRAEIRMSAGDLHIRGGGTKLMAGSERYSERTGPPAFRYDVTGSRGLLTVESPKNGGSIGKTAGDWNLRFGSAVPLELYVSLGAGDADLDASTLPLQRVEVHMGAGDLRLNLAGKYAKDVTAIVNAGAGDTKITLPGSMGVAVDAKVGIGGIQTDGLTKRDGTYYNEAYADGKPAIHLEVHGGVGDITLNVEK
jgi:hypothetical protein